MSLSIYLEINHTRTISPAIVQVNVSANNMKPGIYQFLIGCFASLGSLLFGYDLGVIAEAVASKSFKAQFLQVNGNARSGTVVALFTGGCFVGAFAAGYADRLGRRGTILLACGVFIIGGVIQTAGVAISMLYLGRLIAGIGVGLLTVCVHIQLDALE
jgi:MFS family permease